MSGYRFIKLTKGRYTLVDADEFPRLSLNRWHFDCGYAKRRVAKGGVWNLGFRAVPIARDVLMINDNTIVDHKNGIRLDNRKENLRVASRADNARNARGRHNKTGFRGVCYKGKNRAWQAYMRLNGKPVYLGLYKSPVNAAHAYDAAVKSAFGDFAVLNFPENA